VSKYFYQTNKSYAYKIWTFLWNVLLGYGVPCPLKMIYWNYEMNGKKDQLKIGHNSEKNSAMV
jgi:hypothetical protein